MSAELEDRLYQSNVVNAQNADHWHDKYLALRQAVDQQNDDHRLQHRSGGSVDSASPQISPFDNRVGLF